jgi:hypothetical protein
MSRRYSFIWDSETIRQMIKLWLTRWMIDDWVKIRILFWSLNVWIINLNFSNVFSVSECLILFTKRELKIRTSADTFFLLIDINTSFSRSSTISFCRDAMNDDTTDSIVLKTKLATDVRYFLSRSRPRLADSMNIIESAMRSIWSRLLCDSLIDSINDWIGDSIDDSIDDLVDDSADEETLDENDNWSLLSAWSFW